jgi:hypothetical protein
MEPEGSSPYTQRARPYPEPDTIKCEKCVFWFSLQILSETFLTLRRIQRYIVINVKTSSCKVLITVDKFFVALLPLVVVVVVVVVVVLNVSEGFLEGP